MVGDAVFIQEGLRLNSLRQEPLLEQWSVLVSCPLSVAWGNVEVLIGQLSNSLPPYPRWCEECENVVWFHLE